MLPVHWQRCTSTRCLFLIALFLTAQEADGGSLALSRPSSAQNGTWYDGVTTMPLLCHSVRGYAHRLICCFSWNVPSLDNRAQIARFSR